MTSDCILSNGVIKQISNQSLISQSLKTCRMSSILLRAEGARQSRGASLFFFFFKIVRNQLSYRSNLARNYCDSVVSSPCISLMGKTSSRPATLNDRCGLATERKLMWSIPVELNGIHCIAHPGESGENFRGKFYSEGNTA
jgi:hypothetical protein